MSHTGFFTQISFPVSYNTRYKTRFLHSLKIPPFCYIMKQYFLCQFFFCLCFWCSLPLVFFLFFTYGHLLNKQIYLVLFSKQAIFLFSNPLQPNNLSKTATCFHLYCQGFGDSALFYFKHNFSKNQTGCWTILLK